MMTLVAVAITTAYVYSSAVVFGLTGKMFFWELATLVDIMLLGHWIEMKSVMGASKALEELAKLMPSDAHKLMPDGSVKDVPLGELAVDDKVLIKPGEKIPADGVIVEGESSVNEAMLTGESTPVTKKTGGKVIGGVHQRRRFADHRGQRHRQGFVSVAGHRPGQTGPGKQIEDPGSRQHRRDVAHHCCSGRRRDHPLYLAGSHEQGLCLCHRTQP